MTEKDFFQYVGGGILDAPCDGTACKRGVKDAAPYAQFSDNLLRETIVYLMVLYATES